MGFRSITLLIALGPLAACAVAEPVANGKFQDLLTRNPFTPPEPPPPPPPPEPPPTLELRGVVNERGTLWFSLYDTETKKGTWVRRDETVADCQVREFDLAKEVLFLEGRSRRLALALKAVTPALAASAARLPAPLAPAGAGPALAKGAPPALTVAGNPVPLDDTIRKVVIAQQIQQRRIHRLRQNAAGGI